MTDDAHHPAATPRGRDVLQVDRAELRDTIRVTIDRELVDELDRQRAGVSRSEYLGDGPRGRAQARPPDISPTTGRPRAPAPSATPAFAATWRPAADAAGPAVHPATRRTSRMPATTQHRQLPPLSAPQAQETRDVQRYLSALFGRETRGALIDVRWRYRGGMSQRFLPHHDTYAAARAILRLGLRSDVYVGVAPRRARAGGKDAIERLWALWVDLDQVDAAAALERLPVAPVDRHRLRHPGAPPRLLDAQPPGHRQGRRESEPPPRRRARRRHRRRHQRRDDPAALRHPQLQDQAADPRRARAPERHAHHPGGGHRRHRHRPLPAGAAHRGAPAPRLPPARASTRCGRSTPPSTSAS